MTGMVRGKDSKAEELSDCEWGREGQWDGDSFDYSVSPRRPLRPHPQSWLVNNWLKIAKFIQSNPGKADPYADIDFEEINEQTNLANDEIKCLKVKSTNYVSVFWLLTFPGLLRPVWHQEAGVPLWRRPWWHHESNGIQASKILEGTPQLSSFAKWEENFKQILETHFRPSEEELAELLHEVDEDGSGEIEFGADD